MAAAGAPLSLVSTRTRDGVVLDGVRTDPKGRRRAALVWIHGLGSAFSSGQPLTRELSRHLFAAGIGYVKLNNRGHDVVVRAGARFHGAAFERFGASVEDVRTSVAVATKGGARRVILAGHSTGANKALHYMARTSDRRVKGLLLLGPVSDVAAEAKHLGRRELLRRVAVAERLARRDPDALVPRDFGFWSARRYLSLYRPGGAEDVFPYYRPGARWTALGRVRVPIAAAIGIRDEFLDRPHTEVLDALERHATRARSFTAIAIPGALHGFRGHERQLATEVVRWIRERCLRPVGPRSRSQR